MVTKFFIRWILPLVMVLAAWELGWWYGAGVRPVLPWTLDRQLRAGSTVYLADVRLPVEYRLFHLRGSHSHPELVFDQTALEALPRDTPIVLVCMTGHRSSFAGWELRKMGFTNVASLTGGALGWLLTLHDIERGE